VARHAPAPAPEAPSARHADADAAALAVIQALADRGELDRAIGQCRGLLDHNPLDAMAHFYHGLLLGQAGADAPCEQALRRAVYLDRGFVFAHYHLGLRQLKSGRLGEAGRSFRVVLDLLSPLAGDAAVDGGQELTASELRETVGVHLRTLEEEE
jgi:chemotaxis protein methyltransferase CheR